MNLYFFYFICYWNTCKRENIHKNLQESYWEFVLPFSFALHIYFLSLFCHSHSIAAYTHICPLCCYKSEAGKCTCPARHLIAKCIEKSNCYLHGRNPDKYVSIGYVTDYCMWAAASSERSVFLFGRFLHWVPWLLSDSNASRKDQIYHSCVDHLCISEPLLTEDRQVYVSNNFSF